MTTDDEKRQIENIRKAIKSAKGTPKEKPAFTPEQLRKLVEAAKLIEEKKFTEEQLEKIQEAFQNSRKQKATGVYWIPGITCPRCRRKLTNERSRYLGFGPVCRAKIEKEAGRQLTDLEWRKRSKLYTDSDDDAPLPIGIS